GGKFTAFNFGVAAITTEEVVHQLEYQLGVQNKQCRTSQRPHFDQVQTGGYVQGMNVLAEFHNLHAAGSHIGTAAQKIKHTDTGITGETLVNHFQHGHAPTNNTVVAG